MKRQFLDWMISALFAAIFALLFVYIAPSDTRTASLFLSGILIVFFLVLGLHDRKKGPMKKAALPPKGSITEIALLSEEDSDLAVWELYGKTAAVIGRDLGENHVDINLSNASYASMVDVEHAVLNYTAGNWYVEDLGTENGISVQKALDGRRYKLSAEQMCRLEPGDILYIGMTRMILR
jgi:hypothetical protein